jgi:Amidohydrolase family
VRDPWGVLPDGRGFGGGVSVKPECSWGEELKGCEHVAWEDMAAGCVYGLLAGGAFQELYWEADIREYAFLLDRWQGPLLENSELQRVVVFDPPLPRLPTLIAVAEAEVCGKKGWAVIESPATSGTGCFWHAFGSDMLRIGGLKGFCDGSLGSTTALFFQPYADAPQTSGLPGPEMFPEGAMLRRVLEADRAGLQVMIHAIGDRANHQILDVFVQVTARNGARDRRFRIEHAQHLRASARVRLTIMDGRVVCEAVIE